MCTACHDWDAALSLRLYDLNFIDSGTDSEDSGSSDAGTSDGGCTAAFCAIDTSLLGDSINGAVMSGLDDVTVAGDSVADTFILRTLAVPQLDGGAWRVVNPSTGVRTGAHLAGAVPDDVWVWLHSDVVHQEGDAPTDALDAMHRCGFEVAQWADVAAVSRDEAWLAANNFAVCHWRRDAGFVPATPSLNSATTGLDMTALAVEPGGDVLLAEADGGLYRIDGGSVGMLPVSVTPAEVLRFTPDGELWVLNGSGNVARREADGGWRVFAVETGAQLFVLGAFSRTDVWVGGANGLLRRFTDGDAFTTPDVPLPQGPNSISGITSSSPNDLVITGSTRLGTTAAHGFITRYTRK
jgi:hypothetical protein